MNLIQVPLPKLVPSAANVRKTGTGDVADLAASIHAHGLLQNLTVIDRGEQFEVVAGGMRLRALQDLAKRKLIAPEYSVPCNVLDAEDAHEASLTENVTRHAMHPADEFEAFHKLATGPEKATTAEIAARFGKPERYVQQRMKLANVAPEILKDYRAGKATLEQMMALALTDDQALQSRVWKSMKQEWQRRPDNLRRAITEKEVAASSAAAKFIGVDAYEKAGGQVRRDLFGEDDETYLVDTKLVQRLMEEKLEKQAERVRKEGWKWVEIRSKFDWEDRQKFGASQSKEHAGAVISLNYSGSAEITRGLVKPSDKAAAKKSGGKAKATTAAASKKSASAHKPGDLTFAALQRLQATCGYAVAGGVADTPGLAFRLLAAELADKAFYAPRGYFNGTGGPRQWVQIGRAHTNRNAQVQSMVKDSPAAVAFAQREKAWRAQLPKKRGDVRGWILGADIADVNHLLAFLVAREIDIVDGQAGQKDGIVELTAAAKFDLAKDWRPTADWLATLPKSTVLAMAKDAGATAVELATLGKMPKAKLPEAAAACFKPGWLPKPLRPVAAKTATKKVSAKKKAPAKDAVKKSAGGGTPFPWGNSEQ